MLRCHRAVLTLALAFIATSAICAEIKGRVTAVADGDSFTLTDAGRRSYRVRIQGIDAPERAQDFSQASKKSLSELLFSRDVTVIVQKHDQYGRIVGTVLAGGRDAGLEQLRAGLVWFYAYYGHEMSGADRAAYLEAQREARVGRRGLWSDAQAVPPWRFRREHRR